MCEKRGVNLNIDLNKEIEEIIFSNIQNMLSISDEEAEKIAKHSTKEILKIL